jgi:threonine aldolase
LGAPVGSVFLSDKTTIKKATKIRKVLGGGMRQAGFLAAAGIYALDNHIDRLAEDHQHAKALANELEKASFVSYVMPVETNIVLFDIKQGLNVEQVVKAFEEKGVLCSNTSNKTIRFVTHLDISAAMIDQTIEIIKKLTI